MNSFDLIDDPILIHLMGFITQVSNLLSLGATCKRMQRISSLDDFWVRVLLKRKCKWLIREGTTKDDLTAATSGLGSRILKSIYVHGKCMEWMNTRNMWHARNALHVPGCVSINSKGSVATNRGDGIGSVHNHCCHVLGMTYSEMRSYTFSMMTQEDWGGNNTLLYRDFDQFQTNAWNNVINGTTRRAVESRNNIEWRISEALKDHADLIKQQEESDINEESSSKKRKRRCMINAQRKFNVSRCEKGIAFEEDVENRKMYILKFQNEFKGSDPMKKVLMPLFLVENQAESVYQQNKKKRKVEEEEIKSFV